MVGVLQEAVCLFNSLLQVRKVAQVLLDLGVGQLDQHTCNLWRLLGSRNHLNVVVDEVTHLLLEVGVSVLDGGKQLLGCHHVGLLGSHGLLLLGRLLLWHHVWLLHHGLLLHLLLWMAHGSWLLLHLVVLSLTSLVLHVVWSSSLVLVVGSRVLSVLVVRLGLLGLHDLEKLLDDLGQVSIVVQHAQRLT